ncbi:CLUMA_CG001170, isoform A [Clunio marinus]|uniref:Translation initiation factor eIF2B subunit beta n=1 Tax=Clunio marinus TaxID=568069 RepID=A0A1J1HH70_9DIPT|nr:CLUMA_CG001170, isoform A [Clunio marinus]
MIEGNKYLTKELAQLIHDVKVGKLVGSYPISKYMLENLLTIVNSTTWKTADDLMIIVRETGKILINALPQEAILANIVRRCLKIIREEYDELNMPQQAKQIDDSQAASLQKLVTQNSERSEKRSDYTNSHVDLRENLINHLNEIENELHLSHDNLSQQAPEHVHSSEIILTLGYSKSVEKFLKSVPKERKFEVVVAECAPSCRGHMLAQSLANAKIDATVIPDSAIFAYMSRVNKVIIGTHSVLADGGLRAASGAFTVALAAKHHSTPVIVLVPMFKLSPVFLCNFEQEAFNLVGNTESVLPYNTRVSNAIKAYAPVFDYVPPELITLFISSNGGYTPSYVYRLLTETYHPDDYELK